MALAAVLLVRVSAGPRAEQPAVAVVAPSAAVVAGRGREARCACAFSCRPGARAGSRWPGSFNQWRPDQIVLEPSSADGVFVGTLELPPGDYEYMFVVDGKWISDPSAGERRDDGFGRQNSLLRL